VKLLVVTQYFWPESFIINDLVKTLRDQGHAVTVATGKPNYPEGRVFDGYSAGGTQREMYDGNIEVVRVPLTPRRKSKALDLVRNYASFAWNGYRLFPKLLRGRRFDAILSYIPSPITGSIPAIALKKSSGAHVAIWVQDLWPESLSATGHVKNQMALSLVGRMVRWIYRSADTLLVQSHAFADSVARYADRGKIVYYPNSIRLAPDDPMADSLVPDALRHTLDSEFCVVFTGNLGSVQDTPTIIEAARLLKSRNAPIRVVLVGSGSMAAWARERAAQLGLDNLVLVGRLPTTAMAAIYRRAQGLLVTLKNDPALAQTVPSKMQAYFAAGRPVIAALAGEGARVLREAGAGLACAPENPAALADTMMALFEMSDTDRQRLGAAGRAYFDAHFEMERQAARLIEILSERAGATGATRR
jgi:glycosyltransferase involved in cell wall biosynthesis